MWPQLSVLLISLSLIHGNGISIRQYSSEENSNESDNSVSSEEIGYYVDHQISSVTLTRDINEILSLYPNSVVEKFDQRVGEVRGTLFYTLGARIQNDRLVAHAARRQNWPRQQNAAVTLSYPSSGIGAQVTFISIQVNQTTNLGQAYVVKGGLYQRFITVVVEAYNTFELSYIENIYGI